MLAGLPVKYLLLIVIVVYFFISGPRCSISVAAHFFYVGAFFALYTIYGSIEFGYYAFKELVLALGAILLGLLVVNIVANRGLGAPNILTAYKIAVVALGGIKLIVIIAYLSSPSYKAFLEGFVADYQQLTNSNFITMQLPYGLVRVYMQNDLLAALFPLAVAIIRTSSNVTKSDRLVIIFCSTIVLLGFSRFNIAAYGLSLLAFLWADKRGFYFKAMLSFASILFIALFFQEIRQFIEIRFFSSQNAISDETRINQIAALFDFFLEAPFLGHGLGAYTDKVIRSSISPFSYELQLLSMLPKFGLLGCVIVISYIGYLFYRFICRRQYFSALYLFVFLIASLFNPYLFSSNMLIVYVVIYYSFFYIRPARLPDTMR